MAMSHNLVILSIYLPRRKEPNEKKNSIEDEKTLEELNSADPRSQSRFHLVQTIYTKRIKLPLSVTYIKHLFNRACYIWSRVPEITVPRMQLYLAFKCENVDYVGRVKVDPA